MCRLIAYLGEPHTAAALVFGGDHSLYRQSWAPRELLSGSVNADGYGVVWYGDGDPARIAEPRPIWHDEADLTRTLAVVRSHCVIAALRNGTPGIPVDRSGLLPLVHGEWAFVLNGFVPEFRRTHMRAMRAELPDDLYGSLRGASDSETLFYLTLTSIRAGASAVEALVETVRRVRARTGPAEAQLNMVLSNGASVAAVRTGTVPVTNSLYLSEGSTVGPRGIALASEPPDPGRGWEPVDEHGWVEIHGNGVVEHGAILAK